MGIWQLLLGKNDFSGQGSQSLPQHPVGAVTDAGLAQRAIENHPKGIRLRVLRPEQLCSPLRPHGVGGTGAFADFINLTNGFHSAPLLAFVFHIVTRIDEKCKAGKGCNGILPDFPFYNTVQTLDSYGIIH